MGLAAVASALCFGLLPPIRQWADYHRFADTRPVLGVPNGMDVLSNVGFLVVGVAGVLALRRRGRGPEETGPVLIEPWERGALTTLFVIVGLVALGSAYYHLAPSNERLFWDRLPITMALGAISALVVADRIGLALGKRLFLPLVAAGAATSLWWRITDDLRPYGLFQFFPMVVLPLLLWLRPGRYDRAGYLLAMGGLYGAAKLAELFDRPIFALGGLVSGHTLKHLLATAAVAVLIPYFRRRRPVRRAADDM